MSDAISRFIVTKFGHAIRHDEPLEFTVDEFRQAALAAARAGDGERNALREALAAIRDMSPAELASRARIVARDALKAHA